MNDILKKEKFKKIKIILLILLLVIVVPTAGYFGVTTYKSHKKENNIKSNNEPTSTTTSREDNDIIDFSSLEIKDIINGNFYSCDETTCYVFSYDKKQNHFIFGLALSDAMFDGDIEEITKINEYRYEIKVKHPKVECDDFGKISDEECTKLCSEILCDEETRNYQVDIRDIGKNRIYVKVIDSLDYFDRFTSFDNSLGILMPYDDNSKVLDRFKNNMTFLEDID